MSQHYSIKCPNCAAPLNLLGGGRVESITCNYCKSLIELGKEYKVLSTFKEVEIPHSPFKIGMRGKINEIEWTIIGWILYCSLDELDDQWSEFLLFSPLYGYGWLIYESGTVSFSKRVRDFNIPKWQMRQNNSTVFYRQGDYLLQGIPYRSLIKFVQGELTWIAKQNDQIECWDYKGRKNEMLTIEKSNQEIEVYHTKRLDAREIYKSFGVASKDQVIKKESLKEQLSNERLEKRGFSFYALVFIATILLGLTIAPFKGKTILKQQINVDMTLPFKLSNEAFLQQITLRSDSNQHLNNYQISLYQNNKELLYIDRNRATLNHQKFDNTWNYRAIGANIYLKLTQGEYQLKITRVDKQITSPLTIVIKERVIKKGYIITLFVAIMLLLYYLTFKSTNRVLLATIGVLVAIIAFLNKEGDDDD